MIRPVRVTRLVGTFTIGMAASLVGGWQSTMPKPKRPEIAVRIDGSNGLLSLASALRDSLREQSEDAEIGIGAGLGAKARLDALAGGAIDIALASHGLDLNTLRSRGMIAHRVAMTPVVFAVHADVTVRDLKPGDLCDIFAGRVSTWSAFGGPDITIKAFLRPDSEVDTEVARAGIACLKDLVPGPAVGIAQTSNDMRVALQNTPGAIGLTTTAGVRQSLVALRTLSIASVPPTPENVLNGRYALVRPAYLVTLSPPSPAVSRFIAFVRSDPGAEAIRRAGALPVGD